MESSDSEDHQAAFTESLLWKLLDRHGNTIRLFVSLPEQSPGSVAHRTSCPKVSVDSEDSFGGAKSSGQCVEAILEESTEKLKNLSFQQQQQKQTSSTSESQKSSDHSDFEHLDFPQPENQLASEERSDSDANNDRSTSSVDSDILSSSHSSDTLCNADGAPLANGLDSHSITSSRRSKAHEGKKETWDTAEEDSGTDSEYDENGKSKTQTHHLYFKAESYSQEDAAGHGANSKEYCSWCIGVWGKLHNIFSPL